MGKDFDVKVDLKEMNREIAKILKKIEGAKGVKAGWFEGKRYPNGFEIALNALVQEFGSVSQNIPQRPFISRTIDENKKKWARDFQKLLEGGFTLDKALMRIGQEMRTDLIKMIRSGDFTPNAPSTIKRKLSKNPKGKGEPLPLNETGLMAQSIHTELIKE